MFLYDRALPFYQLHRLPIEAVLTDNGTEYECRPMIHLYEIALGGGGYIHEVKQRPDVRLFEATLANRQRLPEASRKGG